MEYGVWRSVVWRRGVWRGGVNVEVVAQVCM